jgi:hypothetical protein
VLSLLLLVIYGISMLSFDGGVFRDLDATPGVPDPRKDPPAEVLKRANRAMTGKSGYSIAVTASAFGLPQWGGSDSGDVAIGVYPARASASLVRTGDGEYAMRYVDDETFFQRSTCDHFARVPGGGRETMLPFLWTETKALQKAGNPAYVPTGGPEGPVIIEANIEYVGRAQVEIDKETYLPVELRKPVEGEIGEVVWQFSGWGVAPDVTRPEGDVPDQGPGGNPC